MPRSRLKKTLILLVKFGISLGILWWLVVQAQKDQGFANLRNQPKNWELLGIAWGLCFVAVVCTFVRWWMLVVALGLPFTIRDAIRLGFLGYLFNFISLGNVGGDLFKAFFIAREQHGHKTEAVATVIVDRVIGLYSLFILACGAVVLGGFLTNPQVREVRVISIAAVVSAIIGTFFVIMLFVPGMTGGAATRLLRRVPVAGPVLARLMGAVRIYREKSAVLFGALVISLVVQSMFTVAFALIARGLPGAAPSLVEHFLIVPLASLAGALPLPLAGLGAFEGALEFLYRHVSKGVQVAQGKGLIVALCYRVITLLIAPFGVYYWLSSRRDVAAAMHDADIEADSDE